MSHGDSTGQTHGQPLAAVGLVHLPVRGRNARTQRRPTHVHDEPGTKLIDGPTRVTIDGRPAQHVVLTVREDLGCEPGYFFSWRPRNVCFGACWLSQSSVGNTIRVWIVDVGGTRLFIDAETRTHHARTGETVPPRVYREVEQEITRIIGSIRFE